MRAIALLSLWQLKNALRTTLTEPKKLIPLLVFLVFVGFQTLMVATSGNQRDVPRDFLPNLLETYGPVAHAALFLLLVLGSLSFLEMGLTGSALTFSLADIDYLFPSPIPRRVVLAYHLPAILWKHIVGAGVFLWIGYIMLWRAVGPEGVGGGAGWIMFGALAAWMAGHANLAVTLEILFGRGRAPVARKVVLGLLVLIFAWVAFLVWRHGWQGVAMVNENAILRVLFFPSYLLTGTLLAPLTGESAVGGLLGLLAFFAASLALVLTRRENFYEACLPHSERMARVRQAAREGSVGAILALRARERKANARPGARAFTIPPFGRGAMAVFWANLAAAAKRPVVNFVGPIAAGLALAVVAMVWFDTAAPYVVLAGVGYASYMALMVSSRNAFRQSVERQSLIRTMPIKPWKLVAAEVMPVALTASLFGWSAALPLAASPHIHAHLVGATIAVAWPLALVDLCLILYAVTLWYPMVQDKLQQLIAGFVTLALFGGFALVLSPFVAVPLVLHAPLGVTVLSATVGGLAASLALFPIAAHAMRRMSHP